MFPVIVLLGRSNVGKSTLFNKLTHTKGALVSSQPNFTRDRNYGIFQYKGNQFCIIDTGGDLSGIHRLSSSILYLVGSQVFTAVKESDIILFMVDAMVGLVHLDKVIFKYLSVFHKDIIVVVNKTEKITSVHNDIWSFYSLGVQHVIPISALYSRGIHKLLRTLHFFVTDKQVIQNKNSCSGIIRENKNLPTFKSSAHLLINDRQSNIVKISVVGRPNVGKSTFINCILGENRVVVCDVPGTTRDSIYIPLVYNNKNYLFIDTAGIRHRSKINSFSEQYSINKSLQSLSISDVVLLLIDATLGIVDQDMSLLDMILRKGRPLLVLVNKWDCLLKNINKYRSEYIKEDFVFRMKFLKNINICFISSLYNKGIDRVFSCIDKVQQSSVESFSTSKLTNIMLMAVASHQPSVIFGKRIKLKYAHLGDFNPITIIIHGNRLRYLSNDYKRYLSNYFMDALNLFGVKIKIKFHDSIKLHNY